MVKVAFSSALGRKDVKKDAEILLPEDEKDVEVAVPVPHQSQAWCWCMCLGLALMLSGVVIGGVYLYHHYAQEEGEVFFCGLQYREEDYMVRDVPEVRVGLPVQVLPEKLLMEPELPEPELPEPELLQIQERIQILEKQQVELISVPVPEFSDGDPADIVHDFQRNLTAYYDRRLDRCYIITLNTSIVMPPRDLQELLENLKSGAYLPQSYLVQEEMVVTEQLHHLTRLGHHIHRLCGGRDTFKLQRRDHVLGMQKREAFRCLRIRHFESGVVVETRICEL